jgi:adhesin HecA-like repeat protein
VEPLWFYTVGKYGGKWVVAWGFAPPPGAPSLNNPSGTITASSDGQISDIVEAFNSRGGDEFKPTVSSGNGNRLSFQTAALDNQKKFRMIFSSTSSYLTFDLRSSSGTVPAQYVQIGGDMVHPSRTPFIMKNK